MPYNRCLPAGKGRKKGKRRKEGRERKKEREKKEEEKGKGKGGRKGRKGGEEEKKRKKKRGERTGRNLKTLPTPLNMPSMISEWSALFTFAAVRAWSVSAVSELIPRSRRFDRAAPITPKVRKKTSAMMAIKQGIAV